MQDVNSIELIYFRQKLVYTVGSLVSESPRYSYTPIQSRFEVPSFSLRNGPGLLYFGTIILFSFQWNYALGGERGYLRSLWRYSHLA